MDQTDAIGEILYGIDISDTAGNNITTPITSGHSVPVLVDKTAPGIQSGSNITLVSSNSNDTTKATTGNVITLRFEANEDIQEPVVTFTSGGSNITNSNNITYNNSSGNIWTAEYTVHTYDTNGTVAFFFSDLVQCCC